LLHNYSQRHEQMVSNEGARGHGHVEQVNADKQLRRSGDFATVDDRQFPSPSQVTAWLVLDNHALKVILL
jgi:hypothetical protein